MGEDTAARVRTPRGGGLENLLDPAPLGGIDIDGEGVQGAAERGCQSGVS